MQIVNLYLVERQQNCDLDDVTFPFYKEEQVLFCFSQADMGAYTHTIAHRHVGTHTQLHIQTCIGESSKQE